jgi:hypothetical protein
LAVVGLNLIEDVTATRTEAELDESHGITSWYVGVSDGHLMGRSEMQRSTHEWL